MRGYFLMHGFGPSVREIKESLGFASSSMVTRDLRALVAQGELKTLREGKGRAVLPVLRRGDRCPTCGCEGGH